MSTDQGYGWLSKCLLHKSLVLSTMGAPKTGCSIGLQDTVEVAIQHRSSSRPRDASNQIQDSHHYGDKEVLEGQSYTHTHKRTEGGENGEGERVKEGGEGRWEGVERGWGGREGKEGGEGGRMGR